MVRDDSSMVTEMYNEIVSAINQGYDACVPKKIVDKSVNDPQLIELVYRSGVVLILRHKCKRLKPSSPI